MQQQKHKTNRRDYYTLANFGTFYSFDPNKRVIDYYSNKEVSLLDINIQKVKDANNPKLVYIMDNNRKELKFI